MSFVDTPQKSRFAKFATGLLLYTVPVILWGAFVRASLSGDGCGDHWPLCDGELVPVEAGFKKGVEFTHRVTSGLAWLGALVAYLWARRVSPRGGEVRRAGGWVLFFMTTEALVGAAIVVLRMVASNPEVARAGWMAAHLINTFLLLGAMTLLVRAAWLGSAPRFRSLRSHPLLLVTLIALLVTGMSGAVAALGDTLFPAESLEAALAQDLDPSSHIFIRLRIWHPVFAIGSAALILYLCASLWGGSRLRAGERKIVVAIGVITLVQVVAGFVNVLLLAPVWMQLFHLGLADLLWVALLWLWCERATESPPDGNEA